VHPVTAAWITTGLFSFAIGFGVGSLLAGMDLGRMRLLANLSRAIVLLLLMVFAASVYFVSLEWYWRWLRPQDGGMTLTSSISALPVTTALATLVLAFIGGLAVRRRRLAGRTAATRN